VLDTHAECYQWRSVNYRDVHHFFHIPGQSFPPFSKAPVRPMADLLLHNEELPGLRDYSGTTPSHGGHGIDEILNVIRQLAAADIPSCVVGVKALRYYGAARITDVRKRTPPLQMPDILNSR
jgi:hypothetical protein